MQKSYSNSEKFLIIYNEIDNYFRKILNEDERTPHGELIRKISEKNKIFERYKFDLRSLADLRNAIVHNAYKRNADPIAEPHDYILEKYEIIKNSIMYPPLALDSIAIRVPNIFSTQMEDIAIEVMREMNRNIYTHVPVIDDGRIIGVFSESTMFSYLVNNEDVIFEKEMLIKDFSEFLSVNDRENECFEFASRNATVIEIEEIFHRGFKDKKRISVVFITQNGNQNEKILGLITAWDLLGNSER